VTFHWADLALTFVIVAVGCGASYFLLLRKLRQAVSKHQNETERRLSALTEAIVNLESALAEREPSSNSQIVPEVATNLIAGGADKPVPPEKDGIAPEIRVAVAAAAVALLGQNAIVHSVRSAPLRGLASPWSQQGRVSVQASHNLRSRGR